MPFTKNFQRICVPREGFETKALWEELRCVIAKKGFEVVNDPHGAIMTIVEDDHHKAPFLKAFRERLMTPDELITFLSELEADSEYKDLLRSLQEGKNK
ncbi:hypothetical protein A2716_01835 [candidate division WWE3 bacterium RIFCSPHIGHO2_01_FULL_40_23]|uniref:Uncharacterized protein n=1 Tax=candidate division WWE3 bacterium RIFCSPLOWO2_01_FULL_41_18 TaxID=1802625 RepID=A0A1F4VFK6_UNCKA|nr:MAG: hypothetical protein A2716_01835 [candidate division WWE3 bacterium RIFCSPHIGHO2_01_FULL_40_23]OGC55730.1 MAG: hypothetical protein A3A78_01685 [candidate division WWE3 bacterium RIFCSPLOWO2_01_FULL_41_18]